MTDGKMTARQQRIDELEAKNTQLTNLMRCFILQDSEEEERPHKEASIGHVCAFYLVGECTRGDNCPFIHPQKGTGKGAKKDDGSEALEN